MNERLKQLRLARGLSLDQLAGRMGGLVSKQALSKYERGEISPSPAVAVKLAAALGVKTGHLVRAPEFEIVRLEFRKKSTLGKKAATAIQADIQTRFEQRLELQLRLPCAASLGIPVQKYLARTEPEAEESAVELRKELKLGVDPIADLTAILDDHFVHVIQVEAPSSFDGFSLLAKRDKGKWFSAAAAGRAGVSGDRQRLTLAHELGHIVLKPDGGANSERRAFRFAAAFLVPRESLISEIGAKRTSLNLDELIILKTRFGISLQTLVRRTRDLGIISEPAYKSACMTFSRLGWRKKEPGPVLPPEQSTWLKQTALRGWAEGLIGEDEVKSLIGEVPDKASSTSLMRKRAFLELPRARRNQILREQANKYETLYEPASDWSDTETEGWE